MASLYDSVLQKLGELSDLGNISSLMHWDMEVMMPPKGAQARGEQLSTIAALMHRMGTTKELGDDLKKLADDSSLDEDQQKLVEEALYSYNRSTKLPEDFVRDFTEKKTASYHAWTKARKADDFSIFAPHLNTLVDYSIQKAEYFGYEDSPYDALLEDYERGMRANKIEQLFTPLAERLRGIVSKVVAQSIDKPTWPIGDWSEDAQREATKEIVSAFGYDFEAGRLDLAPHPFCTNFDLNDVRITSRFEDHLFGLLYSSIHETGHALYEQGFDPKWRRTPLADAPSLGIHECNSRLWENIVARSPEFWQWASGVMKKHFPNKLDDKSPEDFYEAVTQVAPSLIRVEADEVTYNLHVIIRFEIEKALLEGDLKADDVPTVWNEKYKHYLGVTVPSNQDGCLQDIHWSEGYFGYFPTYTLGNLYSAQVMNQAEKEIPDLKKKYAEGQFLELRNWLQEKIHQVGSKKLTPEIMKDITGRDVEIDSFLTYLESKYIKQ